VKEDMKEKGMKMMGGAVKEHEKHMADGCGEMKKMDSAHPTKGGK
jgi:hypothetical protein